ncbi:gamma-glutamyl phosphate reductase [Weizmannia acidilactici]|uniref:Gamma-glutamyl phosphate reductase n=1 Tax=Weizmannia acidilactici TaxID=2607726 RepID=A0A5J4J1U7_9BACI|nr:glutamate-5-semialdehyde dehydrogenase [Weizmannia acidilactici]GER67677.1 gamma-glutamyl phosphate reductase [Weizmannia acidilactici]GER68916.1 gamma-glutamyl phosphate reductase [Weizmannia acidilactici]GER73904.1 gamma-glutamyl phosphate reductase [Weizmannia acidilactici]
MSEAIEKGQKAREISIALSAKTTEEKNRALLSIAWALLEDQGEIIAENKKDLERGDRAGLPENILDRMMLNEKRIKDMSEAIRLLAGLNDPIGETVEEIEKENGLKIVKKKVPLGVIGMIYEARPNVTADAATLAIKTGNAVILRGSSSSICSNQALVRTIHRALAESGFPEEAVQLIEDTSREAAKDLFHLHDYLDVLIPRGGKNLIDTVVRESSVPVIETGAGNCHLYIDETAQPEMAIRIAVNAKIQRPSVCNAIETILVHENWFAQNGKALLSALAEHGVEIYGDGKVTETWPDAKKATEEDWYCEYLALKISMKTVKNTDEAVQHINRYGTKHSEAIVTEDKEQAARFMAMVDAACVYHNASTRFTDGFEFGYGAEIGISTQKLHARGPMGLDALTSTKYWIYGSGQIRE